MNHVIQNLRNGENFVLNSLFGMAPNVLSILEHVFGCCKGPILDVLD
jgi:hypothetical protein